MTATATNIRKNDFVTLNADTTKYGYTVKAGSKCRVWKAQRDGTLSLSTETNGVSLYVNIADVTKVQKPKADVKVGDIFVCSWGYEQTNIDFYKIVEVTKSSVKYVRLGAERRYTGPMQGECAPTNQTSGPTKTARINVGLNGAVGFKVYSYASAYKWSGQPCFFSEWH